MAVLSLFWGINFPAMKLVLNEMSPWTFRAICLSSAGLGLLWISKLTGQAISFPMRNLKTLLGAAFFNITGWHLAAAYGISLMRGPWYMPLSAVTGWLFLIGGIPIFIGALIQNRWDQVVSLSPLGAGSLIFVVLLPTLFCHWAYYKVVSIFPVSMAAIGTLAIPVVGILTSAWFLEESLEWNEIVAMLFILGALSLVLIHPVIKRE